MANILLEKLKGLDFSASDLARISGWPTQLIEDYLSVIDNLVTISDYINATTSLNTVFKYADYTTTEDDGTILVSASLNAVTIYLDLKPILGQEHNIKCIDDTFECYVNPNTNNLDGITSSFRLYKDESLTIKADNSYDWWII